jgi:hypothetical protein
MTRKVKQWIQIGIGLVVVGILATVAIITDLNLWLPPHPT